MRSCSTPEFRSNVAIFGLLAGLLVTSAVPIALFSVITALIPVWVCRYAVTCWIACCGFDAAFGVDSVSSVHAGPFDGALPVLHCEPTPSAMRDAVAPVEQVLTRLVDDAQDVGGAELLEVRARRPAPASCSGWPTQVIASLAAMSVSSQPAFSSTTGMPAETAALASVGFIRTDRGRTPPCRHFALIAFWICAFSALSSGSAWPCCWEP